MIEAELRHEESLAVISTELPIEWDDVKEFRQTGCILNIKPPRTAKKGKEAINIRLDPPIRRGDVSLLNYICEALITQYPKLIQLMWNNRSARLLARHYHIHRTSSLNTLRSIALFLNSFCEFIGVNPDEIITSLLDSNGNTIQKALKRLREDIEEWQAELKALGYAPNSIKHGIAVLKA